jgi:hypothetical protein
MLELFSQLGPELVQVRVRISRIRGHPLADRYVAEEPV